MSLSPPAMRGTKVTVLGTTNILPDEYGRDFVSSDLDTGGHSSGSSWTAGKPGHRG